MSTAFWIERLEALAVGRERIAVGGRRDVPASNIYVFSAGIIDEASASSRLSPEKNDKGEPYGQEAGAAVSALAFAGDGLLLSGGDDGQLIAWDTAGHKLAAEIDLDAAIRAIAVDAAVARGDAGTIAVGTADGALHLVALAIVGGIPKLSVTARHALSDGAILATCIDPAGPVLAGGADGQLWIVDRGSGGAPRSVAPGGDGGIRAIVALGDGRCVLGCGDGSLRTCYIVGDVEAQDRSRDHGHEAAVRALALGPLVLDDAGREQPRRLFSVGEDGALKSWLVDGARKPRTIELGIGPATAMGFVSGPVAKVEGSIGRLWIASTRRQVATIVVAAELGNPVIIGSALDALEADLRNDKAAVKVKLAAVARLADIAEDEARVLLELALAKGHTEVRVAAAKAIVRSNRRTSRPALRALLNDALPELRLAAFDALLALDRDQPLAAIRVGLTGAEDVRQKAVDALAPLGKSSVIAKGMIADALRDPSPNVRRRAYGALRSAVAPAIDAVRIAIARGTSDIRALALLDLSVAATPGDAAVKAVALAAFDDVDPGVRTSAFLAAVAQHPRLAAKLNAVVPAVAQSFAQIGTQLGAPFKLGPEPAGALADDELEPVFAALACRNADAAIRGAGCLLALGDPRAVGAILQLTREADPGLRRGATQNLIGALSRWPEDDRLATRLSWLLDDPDAEVRALAFDALAKISPELELAEVALRTSQEDIRVRALQILVKLGAGNATADALLGDALDDEAAKVRGEAFRTLWAWHAADPLVPLGRGARSRHGDLRAQVVAEIDRRRQAKQATAAMDKLVLGLVGDPVATVGLAAYAALARQPDDGTKLAIPAEVHLAALQSPAPAVRAAGAAGAHEAPAAAVRGRLVQLVKDDHPNVHTAAIEALDAVAPTDAEGFALAFASLFWDLQVRAGELLGRRRDPRAVAPMTRILTIPKTDFNRPPDAIRQRAAAALALAGELGAIAFLQSLVDDDDPIVREQGARGVATAAQPGHAPSLAALLALLGHADLPVRSWAGEGLAKLGDLRALPVLAGTQRHDHRPLRIGAIVGFVALGPDGARGLRQGLEDRDREIQDLAFSVIVARDAALAAAGIAPDLLVDAMSSPSAEIRFAAARLFERRAAGESTADAAAGIVGPRVPEVAAELKSWPPAPRRAAILQVVADAIASDDPGQRYAAAQVIALRPQPLTFWREAARLAGPSRGGAPAPHTSGSIEARTSRRAGWLRRLVAERRDPDATELEALALAFLRAGAPTGADLAAAQRLVFGVYAGLVRQAPAKGEADETQRVRRDAVGRLVELAREDAVGADAVLPVLGHAVGDPHHLVRQAAMAALRSLYPPGALAPLQQAIAGAADLGKAAIDELVQMALTGDDRAAALIRGALDADDAEVRAHAALRLPRLYPAGSVEPQLLAAQSRHGDIRLAAITQLGAAPDQSAAGDQTAPPFGGAAARGQASAVEDALTAALASEHVDVRFSAALALAKRGSSLGVDVLAGFLRSDDRAVQALDALESLAHKADNAAAAAEAIAARLEDDPERTANRPRLLGALGRIGHPLGAPATVRLLVVVPPGRERDAADSATAALDALLAILRDRTAKPRELPDGRVRARYKEDLALAHLADAARSQLTATGQETPIRARVATALGDLDARGAEDLLARLLGDREPSVRVAAAEALALRAEYVPSATLAPLEAALRGGRRELVLPAALGLAARKRPEAFQPLLLVMKAGEPPERERAVVALGSLGDRRVLAELLPLLDPALEDEALRALAPAAVEALGRLLPSLVGDEATDVRERVERMALAGAGPQQLRAITGLRWAGDLATLERIASDREVPDLVRVHAIGELELAARPQSETVLAELLATDSYSVRGAALAALTKVLGGDRTRVGLHALGSPFDEISGPAAKYLATAGDPATLVARLGGVRSPEIRLMLREGLIRRGAAPVAELAAALKSAEPQPRAEAAWIAGAAGESVGALVGVVADSVARADAGWHAATTDAVRRASEADAWRASLWAATRVGANAEASALGAIGDERAPANVRREAARVVARGGSAAGLAALGKLVGDGDRQIRAIAARTVAAAQPASAAQLVRGLGSRADATTIAPLAQLAWPTLGKELLAEPTTRWWAVETGIAGKQLAELVALARGAGKEPGRLAAIAALGELGGDEAIAVLEAIHKDDAEDAAKLAAWKALKRILRRAATHHEGDKGGDEGIVTPGGGSGDEADEDGGDDDAGEASDEEDEDVADDDDDGDGDDDADADDEDEDDE